ncbi:hypothetical protein ONN26_25310, partial [Salmonella enterica subsp. enterica serovar Muenster]|nr:hypothetical protein [Salmonella enterica subsp. enterica serovar Muenster]
HFASGGTFFMGDARIGSDPDTLSLQLLNTALNSATYGVPTVGAPARFYFPYLSRDHAILRSA